MRCATSLVVAPLRHGPAPQRVGYAFGPRGDFLVFLTGGGVRAHQSALLLCIALNVWATAYLVTRWTGSLLGGLVAGLLFAVSPFHQGGLFHLQRLGTFYYPLILLGLERFGATGVPRGLRSLQWRSCCSS